MGRPTGQPFETVNAELAVRDADDIALYTRLFELLWESAAQGEQASALITKVARELPSSHTL